MGKKEDVHLKLSEELEGIDAELEEAMEAVSETSQRIDAFLDQEEQGEEEPQLHVLETEEDTPEPKVNAASDSQTKTADAGD